MIVLLVHTPCENPETTCNDGINNDANQGTDCRDPDCNGVIGPEGEPCERPEVTLCSDGADNDGDGLTDCADNTGSVHCQDSDDGVGDGPFVPPCAMVEDTGPPNLCGDGIDNDGDGLTDCFDVAGCPVAANPFCGNNEMTANGGTGCGDGIDNDIDGFVDCADSQCLDPGVTANAPCEFTESICDDGIDNDNNGLTDCADMVNCPPGMGPCAAIEICNDGLDNDANGQTDCADAACVGMAGPGGVTCENPEATCDDTNDNDGDGATDCADTDCTGQPGPGGVTCEVVEATCDDGQDNDLDGATDCADPSCDGLMGPGGITCENPETTCDDTNDNDADGATDCDDTDCDTNVVCTGGAPETDCANGVDDDADGATDCADADCAADPACVVVPEDDCGNAIDDDMDGDIDCDDADCAANPACTGGTGGGIPPGSENLADVADASQCAYTLGGDGFCVRISTTNGAINDPTISIDISEGGDINIKELEAIGGVNANCVRANDATGDDTILVLDDADIVCTLDSLNGNFDLQVRGCAEDQDGLLDLIIDLVSPQFPGQQFVGIEQFQTDFQCSDGGGCSSLVGPVSTDEFLGLVALFAVIPAVVLFRRTRRKQS